MPQKPKIDFNLEREAISIVRQERDTWEDATAFITDRVAFNMRNLIRELRKNYWSVFNKPKDPVTGRKKIFVPLTETLVEAVVKNIDLDTKDVNVRAKKANSQGITAIVRSVLRNYLDETMFGEDMDMLERDMAIDGTKVWKTLEVKDEILGKKIPKRFPVDLLNVYIDPHATSIQEAYRFTERSLMTEQQVKGMDDWVNTKEVQGQEGLAKTDYALSSTTSLSTSKMVDVYEMWGKIPKSLITGKSKDKDTEIDGRIVVSGLERHGSAKVHKIEENKKKVKPYEEAWYTRVNGRWHGRGIAEKVSMLQLWINTIVNIRINRSYVSQLGIFKIRKGAGVTPQMVSKLAANGALVVNNMDDIEQFVMQEASQASYTDEEVIKDWAQRITSAFEVVTGEQLPSSTTATQIAVQSQTAQSQFTLVKEGLDFFLQRWLKRHVMPILAKNLRAEEVVRHTGEIDEIRDLNDRIANKLIYDALKEKNKRGALVSTEQVQTELAKAVDKLSRLTNDRFVRIMKEIDLTAFDVELFVTNEKVDKGVMASNLLTALQIVPEFKEQIAAHLFDIMGLDVKQLRAQQVNQQQLPQGQVPQEVAQPQQGVEVPTQNPTELLQGANTV